MLVDIPKRHLYSADIAINRQWLHLDGRISCTCLVRIEHISAAFVFSMPPHFLSHEAMDPICSYDDVAFDGGIIIAMHYDSA